MAKLILINKTKEDNNSPSSYRLLYLLDFAGKVHEKIIKSGLFGAIERDSGLSEYQHSFRVGLLTIDEVQKVINAMSISEDRNHHSFQIAFLIMLNVKNAVNSSYLQISDSYTEELYE